MREDDRSKKAMRKSFKYTDSFEEFLVYCNEFLRKYLEKKKLNETEEQLTKERYREEIDLLKRQVDKDPKLKGALWFAAYLGKMAQEAGICIRGQITQCPFLMYLLHLASYNVLEEGYLDNNYLYEMSNINVYDYYAEERFYEVSRKKVEDFFEDAGCMVMWIGAESNHSEENRVPNGIFVFPDKISLFKLWGNCGKLYDGNLCVLEECVSELWDDGVVYRIRPEYGDNGLNADTLLLLNEYKNEAEASKDECIKILASASTSSCYTYNRYYEIMKSEGLEIYSREDLWEYLCGKGLTKERAYYWTELIRKGKFEYALKNSGLSCKEKREMMQSFNQIMIGLFCEVNFLPCKWNVLEQFYHYYHYRHKEKEIIWN